MSRVASRRLALKSAAFRVRYLLRLGWANRSLRMWGRFLARVADRLTGARRPLLVHIEPTYRCMCRCEHCCVATSRAETRMELESGEILSLIEQSRDLGAVQIIFTGGEPLLRRDLLEFIRHAHRLGLLTRVNTNGLLLTPERAARLREAGLTECSVSVDDARPDAHDRFRGIPGAFAAATEGLRALNAAGILSRLQACASARNTPDGLRDLIALGHSLGVDSIRFLPAKAVGRWEDAQQELLSDEQVAAARALQDARRVEMELPTPASVCPAARGHCLRVSPVGEVTICSAVPYVLADVRRKSLADIWRAWSKERVRVRPGECPMNDPEGRSALQEAIGRAAARLA